MKRRLVSVIALVALLVCALPPVVRAATDEDIVILYENDAHCELEGYSKLAALKSELEEEYAHVGVVSSGDFLQGSSYGSISRGEYVVRLMNLVGYDAIALGNHEFDYGMERLHELVNMLDTKPVCANLKRVGEGECFDPYSIVSYGETRIAYIGITTPSTPEKTSFPTQFVDEEGNEIYTFSADGLAAVVQENIDAARREGADFVIALSHLGDKEDRYNAADVVSQTVGLDAVLDAHSHSVIESSTLTDKDGNEVVYTSTGSKLERVGRLTISGGSITTELISLEERTETDAAVDACLAAIEVEYDAIGGMKVAESSFDLVTHDEEGNRLSRVSGTNLGDLISDAFRYVLGADVAYFNAGGIRSDIKAGDITLNELIDVLPFGNTGVVVKVDGATIVEMLEAAVAEWPEESGNFPHVSGITFSVNVLAEENERVYNVEIENSETGLYEPIDLEKKYTLASNNFILLEGGDGMDMFRGAEVVSDTGILDFEILKTYITENMGGVIDEEYAETVFNITFTEGEIIYYPYVSTDGDHAVWIAVIAVVLMVATIATVIVIRKRRGM